MKYLASMIFFFAFALIGCEKLGIGPKEPKEPVPTVDFTYIEDQVGNVSFASSTTGKVDSYQWIIGKYTNNQPNPANSAWFEDNGTYNVTLKVIGPGGEATATKGIMVSNIRGNVVFYSSNATAPITVLLQDNEFGKITFRHNSEPNCTDSQVVRYLVRPGKYAYSAAQGNKTWSGNITVTGNACSKINILQ